MTAFEDWKKLEPLGPVLIKGFVNAIDIVYHKDEEELKERFANPDIEKRVRRLNALYHTHLWDDHIKIIVSFLSDSGEDFEKKILAGDIEVVEQIARCGGKNWFVFATKYCSFVNKDDYPIYDSLVVKALSHFHSKKPLVEGKLGFESIRQACDYKRYKDIVSEFRKQYCPKCSYKDIDKFLWLVGKNMPDEKCG